MLVIEDLGGANYGLLLKVVCQFIVYIPTYSLHYTYTFRVTEECMWECHNVLLHQA